MTRRTVDASLAGESERLVSTVLRVIDGGFAAGAPPRNLCLICGSY